MREKGKLTSNFSFSHDVFHSYISLAHQNAVLCGNGLKQSSNHEVNIKDGCFINQIPDDKILDRSKLKLSAEDNFEFDVNCRKFSKLVENIVGKGDFACYEQFLLFPQCFQKPCFPGASKGVIVWEWIITHYHKMQHFDTFKIFSYRKHLEKRKNCKKCRKHREKRRNCLFQAISSFLTVFTTLYCTYLSF